MAAALSGAAGAIAVKDQTAGVLKSVMNALERDIITIRIERDPKNFKRMRVASIDIHITAGLVLGAAFLALLYEMANWFAKSIASWQGGDAGAIPDILGVLTGGSVGGAVTILVTDILGNPVIDKQTGQQKQVTAPASFGAAFNNMMRDFTVGGPGQMAQTLRNLVANVTTK